MDKYYIPLDNLLTSEIGIYYKIMYIQRNIIIIIPCLLVRIVLLPVF